MANQSKKTTTKSSSRKKPAPKRRRKKSTKGATFKKSLLIVLGVFLMIAMVVFGYFLGQRDLANTHRATTQGDKTESLYTTKKLLEDLSKIKTEKPREKKQEVVVRKVPKSEKTTSVKPALKKEVMEEKVVTKVEVPKRTITHNTAPSESIQKPKLVIIIDDVSTRDQLRSIQSTGIKLTPSIFPPSQRSRYSHRLAKGLAHYMIHLPMESGTAKFNTQSKTLMTTFNKAQIDARVKELRALFPTARYINNHTGSVFTDNYVAMRTLYSALRKEGFFFVDSRTIASTKVPMIGKEFGDAYVARDVFIDNQQSVSYIHQQLQKAVKKAKKRGYAIAIGHPHPTTMKALSSTGAIFNEVEVVYIDELYQ